MVETDLSVAVCILGSIKLSWDNTVRGSWDSDSGELTCDPCVSAAGSLGRWVGRTSRRKASAAPACGCHRRPAFAWKGQQLLGNGQDGKCRGDGQWVSCSLLQTVRILIKLRCATWRHLLLLPYAVVPGEADPLVRLDAGHTQELHALHAVARCLRVVVAAHAQLWGWRQSLRIGNNIEAEQEAHSGGGWGVGRSERGGLPDCFSPRCCSAPQQSPWRRNYQGCRSPSIPVCILDNERNSLEQ